MSFIYPYFSTYAVSFVSGLSLNVGADFSGYFWTLSIPTYDKYGFAGYQMKDFGQKLDMFFGNSFLMYSNKKVAVSLYYNNIYRADLKVESYEFNERFEDMGLSLGYSLIQPLSIGILAGKNQNGRYVGLEFLIRRGYSYYINGAVMRDLDSMNVNLFIYTFIALKDERFSSLSLNIYTIYRRTGILRYETNITKDLRLKIGAGIVNYDSLYLPMFSVGQEYSFNRIKLGFDGSISQRRIYGDSGKLEWNDLRVSLWLRI